MNAHFATTLAMMMLISGAEAEAQVQSNGPADTAVTQRVSEALVKAGIDPRTTSVRVITTADHTVYLSGLISNAQTIKLAASAAEKAAPSYRVVNNIHSGFFDDPSHVTGDKMK